MLERRQAEKYDIYRLTKIGFEFEFYSDLEPSKLAKLISNNINRKVVLGVNKKTFGKEKDIKLSYHSKIKPTEDTFKLEKDYSGGTMMYELVTGVLSYYDAKNVLVDMLNIIQKIGWTTDYSGLHVNISFDNINMRMENLNVLKFCINFSDIEKKLLTDFKSRKNNVYCDSITRILPQIDYITNDIDLISFNNTKFQIPIDNRYYGVNFQHMNRDGYLEFRYIGGRDYELKLNKIINYVDLFIFYSYDILKLPNFTDSDTKEYIKFYEKHIKKLKGFASYDDFLLVYPNIKLSVDLTYTYEVVKLKFYQIRDKLYEIIFLNGLEEAYINYDSDLSKIQIKDGTMLKCKDLKDIEFFECEVKGIFDSCFFHNTLVSDSLLYNSEFNGYSEVSKSKLMNTKSNNATIFKKSFMKNGKMLNYNGTFEGCIIIGSSADMDRRAEWDDETQFIEGDITKFKKDK